MVIVRWYGLIIGGWLAGWLAGRPAVGQVLFFPSLPPSLVTM